MRVIQSPAARKLLSILNLHMTQAHSNSTIKTLQAVGLSDNEAKLYSLMLERPESTVQELCTRSPIPRTMLYYVLNQLSARGLVTPKKNRSRTVFLAESPAALYDLYSKKERELEKEREAVRSLIPQLKRRHHLAGMRPTTRSFDGVEEYQKALEDSIISCPKEILSYEIISEKKPACEVREHYEKRRVARKIQKKILFLASAEALRIQKTYLYNDFTRFRSFCKDSVTFTDVMLYDGKLLYANFSGHEPAAILIEDQALFEMQKSMFETLWKQGTDRTLAYTEKI